MARAAEAFTLVLDFGLQLNPVVTVHSKLRSRRIRSKGKPSERGPNPLPSRTHTCERQRPGSLPLAYLGSHLGHCPPSRLFPSQDHMQVVFQPVDNGGELRSLRHEQMQFGFQLREPPPRPVGLGSRHHSPTAASRDAGAPATCAGRPASLET